MSRTVARSLTFLGVLCVAAALIGCATPTLSPTPTPSAQLANPASENCVQQGGTLAIRQRGDGGEYGVCLFEDNRQCEEWALLRGDCPVGGLRITGYFTEAAQYCVISGGAYQVTGEGGSAEEEGSCTLPNGETCDAWDYYNGACAPTAPDEESSYSDPFAYCAAVGTIDSPDARYSGPELPDSLVERMIDQGIVTADAPEPFQRNAVWRCMEGSVWLCHYGANIPCLEKADRSQIATAAMADYCRDNPTAESIPAAVSGRATFYEWRCTAGIPRAGQQVLTADARNFLAEFWVELTPP